MNDTNAKHTFMLIHEFIILMFNFLSLQIININKHETMISTHYHSKQNITFFSSKKNRP